MNGFSTKQLNLFGGLILVLIASYFVGLLNPIIYFIQVNERTVAYVIYLIIATYFGVQWVLYLLNHLRHPVQRYMTIRTDGKKQIGITEDRLTNFDQAFQKISEGLKGRDLNQHADFRQVVWDERNKQYLVAFSQDQWRISEEGELKTKEISKGE